jgi:hypothetical protein
MMAAKHGRARGQNTRYLIDRRCRRWVSRPDRDRRLDFAAGLTPAALLRQSAHAPVSQLADPAEL